MKNMWKVILCLIAAVILILFPDAASEGCRSGLKICSELIIPSLFPFFVLSGVITGLNIPQSMGKALSKAAGKLFGVSGTGATALIIGLSCGYPMGSAYITDMRKRELISQEEAERLMGFCSNSGFGFIIGAVGCGVFGDMKYGLILYLTHVLSAVTVGILMKKRLGKLSFSYIEQTAADFESIELTSLLTSSVKNAVSSMLNVCGFIIFFSVIIKLIDAYGLFSLTVGYIGSKTGVELTWLRSLFYGFLELSCAFGEMRKLAPSPSSLTLAAFILGWGGLSVHMQALSIAQSAKIKGTLHFTGHLLSSGIAAAATYVLVGIMQI